MRVFFTTQKTLPEGGTKVEEKDGIDATDIILGEIIISIRSSGITIKNKKGVIYDEHLTELVKGEPKDVVDSISD